MFRTHFDWICFLVTACGIHNLSAPFSYSPFIHLTSELANGSSKQNVPDLSHRWHYRQVDMLLQYKNIKIIFMHLVCWLRFTGFVSTSFYLLVSGLYTSYGNFCCTFFCYLPLTNPDLRCKYSCSCIPSSRQRERPIDKRPQISDSNIPTGNNIWSQVPQGCSIPRHTD
jgi:hypothetical protein